MKTGSKMRDPMMSVWAKRNHRKHVRSPRYMARNEISKAKTLQGCAKVEINEAYLQGQRARRIFERWERLFNRIIQLRVDNVPMHPGIGYEKYAFDMVVHSESCRRLISAVRGDKLAMYETMLHKISDAFVIALANRYDPEGCDVE